MPSLWLERRLATGSSSQGTVNALTAQTAERSPRSKARIAGIFYLLTILTGAFAFIFQGPLRSATLLASTGCYIAVTVIFYALFRPVNRGIAGVAAAFSLTGCALSIVGIFHPGSTSLNPLVFFGCYCLLIGYLILRSTFLPRILGVLMAFGGLGWLTFISPALSHQLSPYNMAPGILGETALTVWLLAVGVDARRCEQASAAA
jgi:cbb3-type cytochrome oxidase subunit 3